MPDKWPLASGNWSNAANWNGGTLPVDGDVIYCDNRTITLDIDLNLPTAIIRNDARPGGTAGGSVRIAARNTSITVAEFQGRAGSWVLEGTAGSFTYTFNNVIFRAFGSVYGAVFQQTLTAYVFNNCQAIGNSSIAALYIGGAVSITGTLSINATNGYGVWLLSPSGVCTVNLTGSIVHGNNITFNVDGSFTGTYNVTSESYGNVSGGVSWSFANLTHQFSIIRTTGILQIPANRGFIAKTGVGLLRYQGDFFWISTDSTGVTTAGPLEFIGTIYGSNAGNGAFLYSSSTGEVIIDKIAPNPTSGRLPGLNGNYRFKSSSQFNDNFGNEMRHVTAIAPAVAPSNVRAGVVYHFGTLTGTCAIPAANQVSVGVPVDNTVGTAILTASGVRSSIGMASANLDSQLAGLDTAIDNIQVDNAAIADAVRLELTTELTRIDASVSSRSTLQQIESSLVIAKEATNQTIASGLSLIILGVDSIPKYGETQQWQNASDTTLEVTVTKVV